MTTAQDRLNAILPGWYELLQQWSTDGSLASTAEHVLDLDGENAVEGADDLLQSYTSQWSLGDFESLPPIVLLSNDDISGAQGAYAASTDTIYLNDDWLLTASEDQIIAVLTEELGAYLDDQLNTVDTKGDEGALFSAELLGVELSDAEVAAIQVEDDSVQISVDGHEAEAEASSIEVANSFEEFSGTQGENNWYYGYYNGGGLDYSKFIQFQNFTGSFWNISSTYYTSLGPNGGHPHGPASTKPTGDIEHWTVRRWIAESTGSFSIAGIFDDVNKGGGGDGVQGFITVNGQTVYSQIATNSTSAYNYSVEVELSQGDTVDFVTSPRTWDGDDSFKFTASITTSTNLNTVPVLTGTAAVLANGTEDTTYVIAGTDLLLGWTDPDGDALSVQNLSASNGTLVDNGNGTWTLTPEQDFNGTISLTYDVSDGQDSTATELQFTIEPFNDAPVASVASVSTDEDTSLNDQVPDASDVDGTIASYTLVDGVGTGNGTLTFNSDGSYSFSPGTDFNDLNDGQSRQVSFFYTATDNNGAVSAPAIVTITVNGITQSVTGTAISDASQIIVSGDLTNPVVESVESITTGKGKKNRVTTTTFTKVTIDQAASLDALVVNGGEGNNNISGQGFADDPNTDTIDESRSAFTGVLVIDGKGGADTIIGGASGTNWLIGGGTTDGTVDTLTGVSLATDIFDLRKQDDATGDNWSDAYSAGGHAEIRNYNIGDFIVLSGLAEEYQVINTTSVTETAKGKSGKTKSESTTIFEITKNGNLVAQIYGSDFDANSQSSDLNLIYGQSTGSLFDVVLNEATGQTILG